MTFGAPISTPSPACLRGAGGLCGGREFGDADALLHRLLDMRDRWRRHGWPARCRARGRRPRWRPGSARNSAPTAPCASRNSRGTPPPTSSACPCSTWHRLRSLANWRWPGAWSISDASFTRSSPSKWAKASQAIRRRNLAAQMDEMVGAQPVLADAVLDGVGELAHVLDGQVRVIVHADAQRVEHGGDAGGRDLRVMRQHRGDRVPAHFRARRIVAFEMVGVKLDQPGNDEIALPCPRRSGRRRRECRRSCRRGCTSEPVTTSSASTMRALVRMVSASCQAVFLFTAGGRAVHRIVP